MKSYKEIVSRLVNWKGTPPKAFFQAFMTQWRIGDRTAFVDNVLRNLGTLMAKVNEEIWQIVGLAYQEATLLERAHDAKLLEEKLRSSPVMSRRLAELASSSVRDWLERRLSPMGRLALRAANFDLHQAEVSSAAWRDAGMISLGFFRILELEFNERLIFPMAKALNLQVLEQNLAALKHMESSTKISKAIEFWQRMIPLLNKAKTERKGLELGSLEMLLQKTADLNGADGALKAAVNTLISLHLSTAGLDAFRSGELGNLLGPVERDKFRNPAAHARFVDLDTARRCKHYVVGALKKLITFCNEDISSYPTIH